MRININNSNSSNKKRVYKIIILASIIILLLIGFTFYKKYINKQIEHFNFVPYITNLGTNENNIKCYRLKTVDDDLVSVTEVIYNITEAEHFTKSIDKKEYYKMLSSSDYFKNLLINIVEPSGYIKVDVDMMIKQPYNNVFYFISKSGPSPVKKYNYIIIFQRDTIHKKMNVYIFKVLPIYWNKLLTKIEPFIKANIIGK